MNAVVADLVPTPVDAAVAAPAWRLSDRGTVGMLSFIVAELAIFTIFVVAYLFYLGKSVTGPMPRDVLEVPVFYTMCLLSSSVTMHLARTRLESWGLLLMLWLFMVVLRRVFMYGTAYE